jgi:subtilisin family serine protease
MRLKLFLILIATVTIFLFPAKAQNEPGSIIPGRMMVQLNDLDMLSSLNQSFSAYNLKVERILSSRLKIALVSYDENSIVADDLLSQVRDIPFVILAQHDHVVQLREIIEDSIPNDPFFGLQWGLHNTGQSGGIPGADIDAVQAWGITKGGLTAHGDTIVVAMIDGGCDLNHIDLNLFKNWNEIPGNGIDDDNNGYIDDFHGWNAYNNTGNIPPSNHGTHVAGTIGAIGNNATGVSGVSWNVKVLPIAGASGFESTVVAAYAYVYDVRAYYDETDGEFGAFVVATNSSFGVDYGQPENYPIWGAMYDSLGTLGILSAAATANLNINIDVVGDVPTAFPSPYLLSVTNTTNQDVKYGSAGYGLETIDLGAPGTQIYSTRNNNSYGYSTGTSMATPHVAGAVGLLMAAADSSFIAFYKNNPAEAALQLKQYILDGTDSLPSLQGITVTGGRLNVYNSMLYLASLEPVLFVDTDTITLNLLENQQFSSELTVSNKGFGELHFQISIDGEPEWIAIEPDTGIIAGGDSLIIALNFNSYGMDPGEYHTEFTINTDHGQQHTTVVNMNVVRLFVGLDDQTASGFNVSVRPNPFSSSTIFNITNPLRKPFYIQITDLQGRLVKEMKSSPAVDSNTEWQWNGDDLNGNINSHGLYFYRIVTDNEIRTGKLIRQR